MRTLIAFLTLSVLPQAAPADWRSAPAADWQVIFNGRDLDGWVVKLAHHELGDNYADSTSRRSALTTPSFASCTDKYGDFGARFGHLFYKQKLSHYVLALEYRFVGEQVKGGPWLCPAEQRRHGALAGARDHPQGSGLAYLGRSAIPRRRPDDDERLHAWHREIPAASKVNSVLHQLHSRASTA